MPYGLFDYGGTIQTMGAEPTTYNNMTDAFPEDGLTKVMADDRGQPVTARVPEEPDTFTRAIPEEGGGVTDRFPEDPFMPVTLKMPEDGVVKIRADEPPPSGNCPKGYEPSGGGTPPRPPIGEGRYTTMAAFGEE